MTVLHRPLDGKRQGVTHVVMYTSHHLLDFRHANTLAVSLVEKRLIAKWRRLLARSKHVTVHSIFLKIMMYTSSTTYMGFGITLSQKTPEMQLQR